MKTRMLTLALGTLVICAWGQPSNVKSPCKFKPPYRLEQGCNYDTTGRTTVLLPPSLLPEKMKSDLPLASPYSAGNSVASRNKEVEYEKKSWWIGQK